ncbi:MAG: prepilin peptidase [Actinobacteria bacterium]|nr:prepilin peptidase [Actinomycetota bacterium]
MTAAVAGAVGLLVGDYLTVVIERVPEATTVTGSARELGPAPAGRCSRCGTRLRVTDLVPLASGALAGGRCRYCGERYGRWHPAAEALTAVTFALIGLRFGASPVLPAYCYLAAVAVALAFIDVARQRLPDFLTLPSYLVAIVALGAAAPFVADGGRHLLPAAIGLGGALAFYLTLALVYPAGIGWGDVKLSGLLGLYLGWIGVGALVIGLAAGFVLAAGAAVVMLATGQATRKSQIAFGPFMLAGALVVIIATGLS